MALTLFNIAVQLSVPRWVVGRSLAAYEAAATGSIAIGNWGWGRLTDIAGVGTASDRGCTDAGLAGRWPVDAHAARARRK